MLSIAGLKTVITAIDGRLKSLESYDRDEYETALEALGHIGSCKYDIIFCSEPNYNWEIILFDSIC